MTDANIHIETLKGMLEARSDGYFAPEIVGALRFAVEQLENTRAAAGAVAWYERGVVLTPPMLREALAFGCPDNDLEQDETGVGFAWLEDGPLDDDGNRGPGVFMWDAEYPEEGLTLLDGKGYGLADIAIATAQAGEVGNVVTVSPVVVGDWPDAHLVRIVIGNQSFMVGDAWETKDEAEIYANLLRQALSKLATPTPGGASGLLAAQGGSDGTD